MFKSQFISVTKKVVTIVIIKGVYYTRFLNAKLVEGYGVPKDNIRVHFIYDKSFQV
jgi:hypothetical protein